MQTHHPRSSCTVLTLWTQSIPVYRVIWEVWELDHFLSSLLVLGRDYDVGADTNEKLGYLPRTTDASNEREISLIMHSGLLRISLSRTYWLTELGKIRWFGWPTTLQGPNLGRRCQGPNETGHTAPDFALNQQRPWVRSDRYRFSFNQRPWFTVTLLDRRIFFVLSQIHNKLGKRRISVSVIIHLWIAVMRTLREICDAMITSKDVSITNNRAIHMLWRPDTVTLPTNQSTVW